MVVVLLRLVFVYNLDNQFDRQLRSRLNIQHIFSCHNPRLKKIQTKEKTGAFEPEIDGVIWGARSMVKTISYISIDVDSVVCVPE